jgi:hypothetical protein
MLAAGRYTNSPALDTQRRAGPLRGGNSSAAEYGTGEGLTRTAGKAANADPAGKFLQ